VTALSIRRNPARRTLNLFLVLAMVVSTLAVLPVERAQAQTNDLTLSVVSARTEPAVPVSIGDPVGDYEYIINIDDTGTTGQRSPADACNPGAAGYPDSCNWTSIAGVPSGSSPIYTQGNQDDFALGAPLNLPNGDYLISVLAGGYKLGGKHFTVPLADPGLVTVELQPSPLPAGTIQASVFEDISPVNGAPDLPAEHGLAGFEAHIADYGGEVTTDIFGNPLGAEYDANGVYISGSGGIVRSKCYVVEAGVDLGVVGPAVGPCPTVTNNHPGFPNGLTVQGKVIIPNVGPNRYGLSVVPPDGSDWIQTTTLEGLHEWDSWVMEGSTGLDTEFVVAGEPFPAIIFGYVSPTTNLDGGSGSVKGAVNAAKVYVPPKGGTGLPGTIWGGAQGMKLAGPISKPWIALSDLAQGDTAVYVGQGNLNGAFNIIGVPDGNYTLTWWDEDQNYILDLIQVTVAGGVVDMGILPLTGWWTKLEGYVFNDLNRNGIRDGGEPGISGYTVGMRKRENSLMDRGAKLVTTEADGYYLMENTYPMTQWLVMEAYNDLFYTTGVTYQADNQPTPTTILGAGVDINVLPIIGLGGRVDWGVHAYDATGANGIDPQNGGIVGTVSYDTTRAELDAAYAGAEDWQPSIPGLTVNLYSTVACAAPPTPLTVVNAGFEDNVLDDGAFTSSFAAGWTVLSTPAGGAGAFNPSTAHLTGQAAEGSNTAYSNGGTISQTLTNTLTEGSTYELSVQVGDRLDTAFPGYTVELWAGGTMLASADQTDLPVVPNDGWVTANVTYEALTGDPQLGQPLEIRLTSAGTQTNFDAVQLTVTSPVSSPCSTGPGLSYQLEPDGGAYVKGALLNSTVNENWERPTGCVARDVDGNPLLHGTDENVLPTGTNAECLEGPLQGVQFGNDFATVDGNYGFGDGCFGVGGFDPITKACADGNDPTPLPGGLDYLVEVEIPTEADVWGPAAAHPSRPLYNVTREEDINVGEGDDFIPAVPPPACAGPLHTVDVADFGANSDNTPYPPNTTFIPGVTIPASTPTVNASFADIGDVIYEGLPKPLCDTKLVSLHNGSSIAPTFFLFTDVPLPGREWGLIVDDLNFSANPQSLLQGEKAGVPFAPVGIYDYANNLVTTVESDYNGLFDVLLPSTNRINCPTPSGVCANMYRFVGNDPGTPGRLNTNYKPQFRTISADFEVFPGLIVPADLAPTQVGVNIQLPNGQFNQVACALEPTTPQIFAVDRPYGPSGQNFTITGQGFGATRGSGAVKFDGLPVPGNWAITWTDTEITVTPQNYSSVAAGPHQLSITNGSGKTTVNGLTYHYTRTSGGPAAYNPNVYEVGPGRTYAPANTLPGTANHAIQNALDAAAASPGADLVVVYPGPPATANPQLNPRGAYHENLIITRPVKLQGVGPGSPDGTVPGSIIDGAAFGGDSPVFVDWWTKMVGLTWAGNQSVNDGAVISIYTTSTAFPQNFDVRTAPSIDGFDLRGGNQQGFPGNINQIGGLPTGLPANLTTQGGAIFANAYARNLQITNNVVQNNGGAYGTIRIGTPDLPAPDNENDNVRIANNRIIANGGTNLAGGIGLFAGADNYEVARNDICGNFSAEYGGGLSAYGYSPGGKIHDNRIYYNASYDEAGGVMIAGQLPANPATLSPGSGPVNIYNNLIQANLANDDGGGLRFLQAGNFPMNVYNNMIVNNVSTHEGGGIGLNDAPNVRVYNNTVMKNLTTATAVTSNGLPAPAGLSTSLNSAALQGSLPAGSPSFSNPLLFNNIFWDNRAGTRAGGTVTGLGLGGPGDIDHWDLGVADGTGTLSPTNSIIQEGDGGPMGSDPLVVAPYDASVAFNVWRNNPNFVGAILVAVDAPAYLLGDYHLSGTGSPAYNLGAPSKAVPGYQQPPASLPAPTFDIDNEPRPLLGGFDAGADEYPGPLADLSISKTNGVDGVAPGAAVSYSIVVLNSGPLAVIGAPVTDNVPAALTSVTWTCTASAGSSCAAASGNGNITTSVSLLPGGSATYTLNGTVAGSGTLVNTASVAAPSGITDPNPANNSATDTDAITLPLPSLTLLDNFNRGNSNGLGTNWSQPNSNIRLNNNNAQENTNGTTGFAYWNGTTGGGPTYGAKQGAAYTMVNGTIVSGANGDSLILKATGGTATAPANYIRVRLTATTVVVETTANSGSSFTNRGTLTATFGNGNTLTAVANADGSVDVWQNATYIGRVTGTTFTGTGRIGMQLIYQSRVDNFSGGTLP